MTIYIQIPLEAQEKYTAAGFIDDYYKTVGEIFVLNNMQEQKGENQMTGTSVCTEAQAIELKGRWPMMNWYKQVDTELPANWVPKVEE